jgi:hypothetical protein
MSNRQLRLLPRRSFDAPMIARGTAREADSSV